MWKMARKKKKDIVTPLLAISFTLGMLLGLTVAAIWIQGYPALQLSGDSSYTRSITIVGVDKSTGRGQLANLSVEVRSGSGRLLIEVPPYENEDTQQAARDARAAASLYTGRNLNTVDIVVSIDNIGPLTTIAGPSASAAAAVLMVASINAAENRTPNIVNQGAVVTASIDSTGVLKIVGEVPEKYSSVREAGNYSLFVIAKSDPRSYQYFSDLPIERAGNLAELSGLVLF
ncbi:MAG: hypothetical protein AB1305_00145 [Candidatus Hadarchaeota archaeon]